MSEPLGYALIHPTRGRVACVDFEPDPKRWDGTHPWHGSKVVALVPAPPEGAPSWQDLADALRDCVEAIDRRGFVTRMVARQNASALLSRIPKVEP